MASTAKKRAHRVRGRLIRVGRPEWHVLPSFLVLGAMKAGTSALFHYLKSHPGVVAPRVKELNYFGAPHRYESFGDYRREFPHRLYMQWPRRRISGEATPFFSHPLGPARVRAALPDVPMVVLLREPVSRAHSHFHHARRHGHEPLETFAEAVAAEPGRLAAVMEQVRAGDDTVQPRWAKWAYLHKGMYADHLEAWFAHFPRDQILVLRSEDLRDHPAETFATVLEHLGLGPAPASMSFAPRHEGTYEEMDPALKAGLDTHFADSNRRLRQLVGISWP
ncbi:MAG: sulfotransferase domain-containing protein [Acidimicrobiales bacterium]